MENTTASEHKSETNLDQKPELTSESNLATAPKRNAALISEDSIESDDDNEEDEDESPRHCFQCFSTTSKKWFSGSFGGDEAFVCETCYNKQNPAPAKKSPSKDKTESDNSNPSKRQRHRTQDWEKNLLELFYKNNVEKNRDNKSYRYPKTTEFKQLVEQLKWDASRVRVWIENRKNKDKDKPRDPVTPSISKGPSDSSESLVINRPVSVSPITATVTAPPLETLQAMPTLVTTAPPTTVSVPVPTSPPPAAVVVKSDINSEAIIRSLTSRVELLEKTIQKLQQQNATQTPSSEHHSMLLRKISELEMKVESQNKVFQHLAMLDNHNRVLSSKVIELEKAVTYTIMAQHNSMNYSSGQYAHTTPPMSNPSMDHHIRATTTSPPQLSPPVALPSQQQESHDQKKKIMLFGKVVDPQ